MFYRPVFSRSSNTLSQATEKHLPGGNAAEHSIKVIAAKREKNPRGRISQFSCMLVPFTVRVDEVADFWQQLFYQHGLV